MPFKSPFGSVDLPEIDLFSFIFKRKDRPFPDDHVIFHDAANDATLSTSQLQQLAVDFGKGLRSMLEWQKGDVLSLFTANSIDVPPITLGTHWAGGVVSPANPGYTADELAYQLKDSGARAIITQMESLNTVRKACSSAGLSEDSIFILGTARDESRKFRHWRSIRSLSGTDRFRPARINPKVDSAFLVYSSGTTGKPKGVKLTHYNLTSSMLQSKATEITTWDGSVTVGDIPLPRSGGDKILAPLPFFHIYGLNLFVLNPMYNGVTTFIMSRFDLETWCSLVQKHKITYSFIVPPIVLLLAKHPKASSYDLSSIRMVNSGAAPLTRELVEAVYKRTGIRVKQGYGLSETSPGLFHQRWQDWYTGVGSVGWLLPNLEAKLCKVESEASESKVEPIEVEPGEAGELYVRGPNVFQGYHNNAAATAECLSSDGWFRTGDIGYIDKNNNLFITDRIKELIKYKGFQVAPAELEGYLTDHPLVSDCAVVGVDSEEQGTEIPRAYIVLEGKESKHATQKDAEDIIQWMNGRVANHKKLRGGVRFVDTIAKTASGKILRRLLKEQAKMETGSGKLKAKL